MKRYSAKWVAREINWVGLSLYILYITISSTKIKTPFCPKGLSKILLHGPEAINLIDFTVPLAI